MRLLDDDEVRHDTDLGAREDAQKLADKISEAGIEVRVKDSPVLVTARRTGAFTAVQVKVETLTAAKKLLKR